MLPRSFIIIKGEKTSFEKKEQKRPAGTWQTNGNSWFGHFKGKADTFSKVTSVVYLCMLTIQRSVSSALNTMCYRFIFASELKRAEENGGGGGGGDGLAAAES